MSVTFVESDIDILDFLRSTGPVSVSVLARHFGVTPTAVRQRLNRLVAEGLVERHVHREGRGRPRHLYRITGKGRLKIGSNYADLARALWLAVRKISDQATQQAILESVAEELARLYLPRMAGITVAERMEHLARIFSEKRVPLAVEGNGASGQATTGSAVGGNGDSHPSRQGGNGDKPHLGGDGADSVHHREGMSPALVVGACPYPDLAEHDPTICEFERIWLGELLGVPVNLTECRRDGLHRCRFEVVPLEKGAGTH